MAEVKRTYYKSGKLRSEVFELNGKKNGIYKEYYENSCENMSSTDSFGQLFYICSYIDGKFHGEFKSYHKNGQLNDICSYIDGKKNGEAKTYDHNGRLCDICSYIDGKEVEYKRYYENVQL